MQNKKESHKAKLRKKTIVSLPDKESWWRLLLTKFFKTKN